MVYKVIAEIEVEIILQEGDEKDAGQDIETTIWNALEEQNDWIPEKHITIKEVEKK